MSLRGLQLVSGPAAEPVSRTEAKLFCRVDASTEDDLIDDLITEARKRAERVTGKSLVVCTWRLTLDGFPAWAIDLPNAHPLVAISSIAYTDELGDAQTLSSSLYQADTLTEPGRVAPAVDQSWPSTQSGKLSTVRITYTAGSGTTAEELYEARGRILAAVAYCYRHREARDEGYLDGLFDSLWAGSL
jgi:uncharacterized phiE125 gp8 family phage protein